MTLEPCHSCNRHIHASPKCPFCHVALAAVSLFVAGCDDKAETPKADETANTAAASATAASDEAKAPAEEKKAEGDAEAGEGEDDLEAELEAEEKKIDKSKDVVDKDREMRTLYGAPPRPPGADAPQ